MTNAESQRKYYRSNPHKARERDLLRRYRITIKDYEQMLVLQGGHCKLCPKTPQLRRLHVDHCHATKCVRGLLCAMCNQKLGWFESRRLLIEAYLL